MKTGNVYVTQIPHRRDKETDAFVPSVNINSAAEFGEIKVMMPPRVGFFVPATFKAAISVKIQNFDIDHDCLLPLGDPVLNAAVCAMLGNRFPYFDVLKWDKGLGRYVKNRVVI